MIPSYLLHLANQLPLKIVLYYVKWLPINVTECDDTHSTAIKRAVVNNSKSYKLLQVPTV